MPSAVLPSGRGIKVWNGLDSDAASITLMDNTTSPTQGAAYVLISHGKNGVGGYVAGSGVLGSGTPGSKEIQNSNNQVLTGWYAIDAEYNDNGDTANFDDLVLRASIMRVVLQAQRGPRAH